MLQYFSFYPHLALSIDCKDLSWNEMKIDITCKKRILSVVRVITCNCALTFLKSPTSNCEIEYHRLYYIPDVSSMKYCCLGVFRKEYFRLVTK